MLGELGEELFAEDGLDGLLGLVVGVDALCLDVLEYGVLIAKAPVGLGRSAIGYEEHMFLNLGLP